MTSGWTDIKDPKKRATSIGMTPAFTMFLGGAEVAGGLGLACGVLTQLAAIGLMLLLMNVVIACADGGRYVLSSVLR
jgi:uncharacterized membrane protein YphA (DoxX/SURF4 family)